MKIANKIFLLVITVFIFSSCANNGFNKSEGVININLNNLHQIIDGFGGSNAWTRLPSFNDTSSELVKLLFSRTEGMGFSILRNRIPFRESVPGDDHNHNDNFLLRNSDYTYSYTENANGTKTFNLNWSSWDLDSTKKLISQIKNLGDKGPEHLVIMSVPWTPPNNRVTQWKEDITGVSTRINYKMNWGRPELWGRLKREHYNDYADLLADYVKNFESNMGHPLSILSVQNEPNWKADWECAYWSGIDLRDFIKTISQRFPIKGVTAGNNGVGIMMPEFENFNINFNEMIKPSMDDPDSQQIITHIALHQYNAASDASSRAGARAFPEIIETGKRFWQTEVSGSGTHLPKGIGIQNALFYARMIHWDLTLTQTNAFLYWWLWTNTRSDDFPGALVLVEGDELKIAHRLYAMGQYSRFIRPGWHRIECVQSPLSGIYASAYRNTKTNEIAIVIINETITLTTFSLDLGEYQFDELAIWRTSQDEKLKSLGRQRTNGSSASVILAPLSITTYYGRVKQ
ncbi:MAG: hypothetical protein FWB86_10180 [Treponema sp.]|nr:hypothetical protein [Treponema sp.]